MESITEIAAALVAECKKFENDCLKAHLPLPSLTAGTNTSCWSDSKYPERTETRIRALGLLDQLQTLLLGPHDFLHEFVAPNWDHGALYAVLQSGILTSIGAAPKGCASLTDLASESGIPEDKLVRILRLLCCRHILEEPVEAYFACTAVGEELQRDSDFRAWVEFQLFDTRIASAHLAEALLAKPNSYIDGVSGFKLGWGAEMYDWHTARPAKQDRFRRAMAGVSKGLDPADSLIKTWIEQNPPSSLTHVVELGGRYGFASVSLVADHPQLKFEVRCESQESLDRGQASVPADYQSRISFIKVPSLCVSPPDDPDSPRIYLVRNLLWNWKDEDVVRLLQSLVSGRRTARSTRILITDGVSPGPKELPPHVEIAYRRRDITTMTMHNVKQRSQSEWLELFGRVGSGVCVETRVVRSSHVYKGLWELNCNE
ncbi:S-adenosyl-L-methionine-dependent methyltransferase [Aspergillus californicus]